MTGQIVTYALATAGVILLLCAVVHGELRVRAITREIAALSAEATNMKLMIVNQDDRVREQQKLLRAAAVAMKEVAHADRSVRR